MKILSLNCWSGRRPNLVEYLQSAKADIYCLQEVLNSPPGTPDELMFAEQGSTPEYQRTKLFAELCAALPHYQAFHLPAAEGYLHDGAKTQYKSQYGIATFVGPGIPIIGTGSRFVYGEYRYSNWEEPPLPRQAHAVRVWDYDSGSPLVVAHMHGMWIPNGKQDTKERRMQACRFGSLIVGTMEPNDLIVACGDWNVLPGSETLSILRDLELQDLVTGRGHTDTRTSYYKKDVRYADYMMVSPDLAQCEFEVVKSPEVSDHRPLLLDIE